MTNVFNTTFEISLRIIILLNNFQEPQTLDMLYTADFISTYGADFGVSEENLNGENQYKFCEISTRRELVRSALKELILLGMVTPDQNQKGFEYSITPKGKRYCRSLGSEYAKEYSGIAKNVTVYVSDKSVRMIVSYINELSVKSLRKGAKL